MDVDAKTLFRAFFDELERRDVPYVILHSYQELPERIGSDIDYAVRDSDIPLVHSILHETAARSGWLLAQTLQYDIASYYTVLVNPERPGMALKLDRCSHYTRNGCLFIRDEALLANRKKFNGFSIPCASSEFIYTLAKVFAKDKQISDHLSRLRELYAAEPRRSEELFHLVFGPDAGALGEWFKHPLTEWQKLSRLMHERNRYKLPERAREWRRRLRRFLNPTGLNVAVWGSDREVVDAFILRIERLTEPCFRRQITLPSSAGGFWGSWRDRIFRDGPAYRRSTLIIVTHRQEQLARLNSMPSPDLLFWLGDGKGALNANFILLDSRDIDSAAAGAWREITSFLSRRDERRWPFLKYDK